MNPPPDLRADDTLPRVALDRHQRRRAQGIPTLSVLVGDAAGAARVWRAWADADRRGTLRTVPWPGSVEQLAPLATEVVLFTGPPQGDGEAERTRRLAEAVRHLSAFLVSAGPDRAGTVWAVAVTPQEAAAYLRGEAYTRARALFAEGTVALPGPDATLLTRHGAGGATGERFREAAAAGRQAADPAADPADDDRARSAAERFLHDLLADLPATAGLFELNVRLGFCFGPMRAEVDLLAESLRLAVEIDGYHHFRDPESYRRDRRKDACLQKEGYLVLRFLAEDVVVRLEEVLEEILAAVAFRRIAR